MKRDLLVGVRTERSVRRDPSSGSFRLERFLRFFSESATGERTTLNIGGHD